MQRGKLTGKGQAPARIPANEGRSTNVARAYIEGLERDRRELRELEERYDKLVWQTIQVSAYAKALYVALNGVRRFLEFGRPKIDYDRMDDLLNADRRVYAEIWNCECGHHRYDHDDNGKCNFLGCRHICG